MRTTTKKVVFAAMFAALVCVATMLVKIPSPLKGYINLGDCMVLAAGFVLSPVYGFMAAGLGSMLADLFAGYALYAPVTFLIKGVMALIVCFGVRYFARRMGKLGAKLVFGVLAEIVMIGGYFLFEGVLYGFGASLVNIPANAVQGVAGVLLGVLLAGALERSKIDFV